MCHPNQKHTGELADLLNSIEEASIKHRRTGILIALISIVAVALVYYLNNDITIHHGQQIEDEIKSGRDAQPLIIYELISKVISGSFLIAVFYWLFRVCMASFDQSVRYRKRLHSALFLERYLDKKYPADANYPGLLRQKMEFYEVWVKSTDSAFGVNRKDQQKMFGAQVEYMKEILSLIKDIKSTSDQVQGGDKGTPSGTDKSSE